MGLAAGTALSPGLLHGEPARLLTTFLGLVSASILPAVSLVLGSMTTGGRSVLAINRLEAELRLAINALFVLLGSVGLIFAAIFMLSIAPPDLLSRVPYLTSEILPRFGQGIVVAGTALILMRAGQIPGIIRRSLEIRREIAVDEAKKATLQNAGKIPDANALFTTNTEFGRTISLEEA